MPKHHPIWNSFASGEVSPRIWSRSDIPAWRSGCAELTNFIATSHGPIVRRGGWEYLGKSTATAGAVFGFQITVDHGYQICITETDILIFDVSVRATDGGYTPEQTLVSPWSATEVPQLRGEILPGSTEMYLVCPTLAPQSLTYDPDAALGSRWAIADVVFSPAPVEWAAPDNWPSAIAFFQGRSWFASTNNEPETFWGSESGLYNEFTEGANADQALEFTLAKSGKIMWLAGAQTLLIGTVNGEYVANSDSGVINPGDIDVNQQSAYGSRYVQARMVGNITLYVSPDGRKLRDVGYRWEENNWLSRDITFVSEHITKANLMAGVTWAQNPDNLIWMHTDEGDLLGCTYERNYEVIGWHRHTTEGQWIATGTVDVNGTSELACAVKRVDGEIYFEWYNNERYLDSALLTDFGGTPSDTVTGLEHLEGMTVAVLADDAVHPDRLVTGGQITLQKAVSKVSTGLRFISKMVTLPLDYTPEEPGTSQHFMKRWNKVYVRLLNSARPKINGDRQSTRTPPTPMNTPQPVTTEDTRILTSGWSRYAQVEIEMEIPLACNIASMFGELRQEMDRT